MMDTVSDTHGILEALEATLAALLFVAVGAAQGAFPAVITSDGPVEVDRTFEVALVFAQDGFEHLVLEAGYAARDSVPDGLPRLGWVIPVPQTPANYSFVADTAIADTWNTFARVSRFTPAPPDAETDESAAPESPPVRLVPSRPVGRWQATVIPSSVGVSRWLNDHGFGPLPEEVARAYGAAGWSFLGGIIEPDPEMRAIPREGQMQPICLTFGADRIVYPLRLAARERGFASYLFIASADPIHLVDAHACGFVALQRDTVRKLLDRLLWQASISESTRAVLWYGSGGTEPAGGGPPSEPWGNRQRDRAIEQWAFSLTDLVAGWRMAVVNRRTDFTEHGPADPNTLEGAFAAALAENRGNAPASAVRLYRELVKRAGGRPLDSLYVSVLMRPALSVGSTDADRGRWQGDALIRFRTLLRTLPPLESPPGPAPSDFGYRPPLRVFLPMSPALDSAFARLLGTADPSDIHRAAGTVLAEARRWPHVRLTRALGAAGLLDDLVGSDRFSLPPDDPSLAATRSIQAFDRAFRQAIAPLQAVWVAAQETDQRPNPLVIVVRLRVRPDGGAEVEGTRGNLPPGLPTLLLRHVVNHGVRLPPARDDGVWDYVVVIEG